MSRPTNDTVFAFPSLRSRMSSPRCICGCGKRAVHRHHVFTEQMLRPRARELDRSFNKLREDGRNRVWMAMACHLGGQHGGSARLPVVKLPDSVFEFGLEVFGAGRAYNHLRRYYRGEDPRLDALLVAWEVEAA